jgi:hypothetical protein
MGLYLGSKGLASRSVRWSEARWGYWLADRGNGLVLATLYIDEIKQYRYARWVTPLEALSRIYGFDLSDRYLAILSL